MKNTEKLKKTKRVKKELKNNKNNYAIFKPNNENNQFANGTVTLASMNAAIINRITARHKNIKDSLSLF